MASIVEVMLGTQKMFKDACTFLCKLLDDKRIPEDVRKEILTELSKIRDNLGE